jgi:uncharacterized double-CXXCG motif protein
MTSMYFYRVIPPDDEFQRPLDYEVEGKRPWSLPGVECPRCRETWANVGTNYPTVDLSGLAEAGDLKVPRAVPLEEFERLRAAVESQVPAGTPLPPGTGFGPLIGKAKGRVGDFAWIHMWSLLIRTFPLAELERAGVRSLRTVKPRFRSASETATDLVEIEIEARAWLVDGARKKKPCRGCGRRNYSKRKDKELVIDGATIPEGVPLFRLHDLTTHIIANQEFHDAVCYFEFDHIDFEDVEVAP